MDTTTILALFSVFVSIAGLLVGFYFGRHAMRAAVLKWAADGDEIYGPDSSLSDALAMTIENRDVAELSRSRFGIWHSGGIDVPGSLMVEDDPLRVVAPGTIYNATIVSDSGDRNSSTLDPIDDVTYAIDFKYLSKGDGFIAEVHHGGVGPVRVEGAMVGPSLKQVVGVPWTRFRDVIDANHGSDQGARVRFRRLVRSARRYVVPAIFVVGGAFSLGLNLRDGTSLPSEPLDPEAFLEVETIDDQQALFSALHAAGFRADSPVGPLFQWLLPGLFLALGLVALLVRLVATSATLPRTVAARRVPPRRSPDSDVDLRDAIILTPNSCPAAEVDGPSDDVDEVLAADEQGLDGG